MTQHDTGPFVYLPTIMGLVEDNRRLILGGPGAQCRGCMGHTNGCAQSAEYANKDMHVGEPGTLVLMRLKHVVFAKLILHSFLAAQVSI